MTVAGALAGLLLMAPAGAPVGDRLDLPVPVERASRQRCGQAAFTMVLRYWGADSAALRQADAAYDPTLRGSLVTDLAAAARRAGYDARIATLEPDSLVALVAAGVPPIVLYQNGRGPLTVPHYGVVRGWDPERRAFLVNDGGAKPRAMARDDLAKRWRTAGSQALIIRPPAAP